MVEASERGWLQKLGCPGSGINLPSGEASGTQSAPATKLLHHAFPTMMICNLQAKLFLLGILIKATKVMNRNFFLS